MIEEPATPESKLTLSQHLSESPISAAILHLNVFHFLLSSIFGICSFFYLALLRDSLGLTGAPAIVYVFATILSTMFLFFFLLYVFLIPSFVRETYDRYVRLDRKLVYFSILYFESIIFFALIYALLGNFAEDQFSEQIDALSIHAEWMQELDAKDLSSMELDEILSGRIMASVFSGIESFYQALYFSVITQTTIGYGDIHPTAVLSRMVSVAQAMTTIVLVVFVIGRMDHGDTRASHETTYKPFRPRGAKPRNMRLNQRRLCSPSLSKARRVIPKSRKN